MRSSDRYRPAELIRAELNLPFRLGIVLVGKKSGLLLESAFVLFLGFERRLAPKTNGSPHLAYLLFELVNVFANVEPVLKVFESALNHGSGRLHGGNTTLFLILSQQYWNCSVNLTTRTLILSFERATAHGRRRSTEPDSTRKQHRHRQ